MRILAAVALLFASFTALADESGVAEVHALAYLGSPKYDADFTHFEYVNPDATKGGNITLGAFGSYDSLNYFRLGSISASGLTLIYDTLLTKSADEPFSSYGRIADRIRVAPDAAWAAYHIHPEARWHDGKPVTPSDVVWSFEVLAKHDLAPYAKYYHDVTRAVVEEDGWVRFDFARPGNHELPLIIGELTVLPEHHYEGRDFHETSRELPLGSGPYRVAEHEFGRFIRYERVADYWGRNLPANRGFYNFDSIRYDVYQDIDIMVEALKAGELDFFAENNSKRWATAYTGPHIEAGRLLKEEIPHGRPTGMQSFAFNLRRPIFEDPRVRHALELAFDFEWSNENLFYGAYKRTTSYFSNSELAATGLPSPEELVYLEPHRDSLPAEVFTDPPYSPPVTDGSGSIRQQLRQARALLAEAGWTIENNVLVGPEGQPMEFEILLRLPGFERIVQPYILNLEKLGVRATLRTVDSSQYQNRTAHFDYDMIVSSFGQSDSPGNEQRDFWGTEAADEPHSRNMLGLKNPVIDQLVENVIYATSRDDLVTAVRALDRVLRWGHYVVPHWHITVDRVAYWNRFDRPAIIPKNGANLMTWWIDPERDALINLTEDGNSQ